MSSSKSHALNIKKRINIVYSIVATKDYIIKVFLFCYLKEKKLDREIKELTYRLKNALARKKQGFTSTDIEDDDIRYASDIIYRFQCPRCKGYNTKRSGLTTQIDVKFRLLCLDCRLQRGITKDETITPFFILTNQEIKDIIKNDLTLSKEKRDFFLYKYLIKQKN